jgi:ABC-type branched-subunit amino acid transport system ATPase component
MSLLAVDALEAGYDDALVLFGVSLTATTEIVAVIGPSRPAGRRCSKRSTGS